MEIQKDITFLSQPFLIKQLSLKFNTEAVDYSHALPHNVPVIQAHFLIYIHKEGDTKDQTCKIGVKDNEGKIITWLIGQDNGTTITLPVHPKRQLLLTLDKPQSDSAFISIYLTAYRKQMRPQPLIVLNTTKLSASSSYSPENDVVHCYLDFITKNYFAWTAKLDNIPYQFIEADFGRQCLVSKIAIQGRGDTNQWVTRFAAYKKGRDHCQFIKIGQFNGSSDRNTIVFAEFEPVVTQFIRVVPLAFKGHISMRWEVYGSVIDE